MMRKIPAAGAIAAALAILPAPAAAAPLVLRAIGPSATTYKQGRVLPDNSSLSLKAGDVLTVLVASGKRILRGPGTFSLGGGAALASAFNPRGRFGALRSGEVATVPSLWDVDVSQSGTVCLADAAKVTLWRPEAANAGTLVLKTAGGASQWLEWKAGQATFDWPAALPIAEGKDYDLAWTGGDTAQLKFVRLAAVPDDLGALAKALIDHGCQSQLDLLIDSTPTAQ
ncbi:MAG TPA: hypothetical protein VGF77_05120 [Allosphingosinicella sp.]|jgi:hypothetical protein